MATDKLIRMATQMADFFRNQPEDPAEAVADHINHYWAYPMRQSLIDQIKAGAAADPIVRDCVTHIKLPAGYDAKAV